MAGSSSLLLAAGEGYIYAVLLIFLVPVGLMAVLSLWALRPWLRATLSGAGLSVPDVIGMKLRRINVETVVNALVLALQSGVEVSHVDLQRAYLRGVDVEKITLALIELKRRGADATVEQLVELELAGRLAEKLQSHPQ